MIRSKQLVCKTLSVSAFLSVILAFSTAYAQTPPTAFGLTPSDVQVEYFQRERTVFIHFGMNTFTNVEWGDGTENPNTFNPTNLDCNQWCRVFKKAGFTCATLTVKHHDGFCLWPSAYTSHCVKSSSWKGGNGDVVKEFTEACRAAGIKAGIYLSPWDRHEELSGAQHPFGTQAYIDYYANQVGELMRNYGTIWYLWWDGCYAEPVVVAGYNRWADTVHKYQPQCNIFGTRHGYQAGTVRWCGNESGVAGDPTWSTVMSSAIEAETGSALNSGDLNGDVYRPSEAQTSIRPGWFWHSAESPKSVSTLWDYWFNSVARNAVMHLNIPPDTRGLVMSTDSAAAYGMYTWVYGTFRTNLLAGATATALHPRGTGFEPAKMLDADENTYFASADGRNTDTITFVSPSSITFDCIMMQEVIQLGHRTLNWSVDYSPNGTSWTTISAANNKQCIGYKRAVKWTPATTATQVRLRITSGRACPAIHTFGVYRVAQADPPTTAVAPRNGSPSDRVSNTIMKSLRIEGNRIVLPAGFGAGAVMVNIFDLQGSCVQRVIAQRSGLEQRLALPSLKPGFYLVRCCSGALTLERKFMSLR